MKSSVARLILCTIGLLIFSLLMLSIPNQTEVPLPGWEPNVSRNTSHYLSNDNFNLLPQNICHQQSLLLMIVCSSPKNFEARSAIRKTWGHPKVILERNVLVYFLVGETPSVNTKKLIEMESDGFGDIIRGKFVDSYLNLTLKTVNMLKVASQYCAHKAKFLLKVDDDILLNVEKLVELLKNMEDTKNILMGKLLCGSKPVKSPSSKWYTPKYLFEGNVYPSYLSGTAYLMSMDVAVRLLKATLSTPLLHLEDVYVTGICANKIGLKPKNNIYFTHHYVYRSKCTYGHFITMHHFSPSMLIETYAILSNTTLLEECRNFHPIFDSHSWVVHNILKPNRLYRKSVCIET